MESNMDPNSRPFFGVFITATLLLLLYVLDRAVIKIRLKLVAIIKNSVERKPSLSKLRKRRITYHKEGRSYHKEGRRSYFSYFIQLLQLLPYKVTNHKELISRRRRFEDRERYHKEGSL